MADQAGRFFVSIDIDPRLRLAIDAMFAENDRLRGLLEEAWAWSSPAIAGQLGYLDLARRINEALGGEPSGNR